MMKDAPVVIVVSKKSAKNLVKHLGQVVQCAQTLNIVILTIKFVKRSVRGMETVVEDTNVLKGNALRNVGSQTSVQKINIATCKISVFTIISYCFFSDNFIYILFALLGVGKFVKKNAMKILIVKAMRFALMGNVSLAVLVMITARKEKLVEMANA